MSFEKNEGGYDHLFTQTDKYEKIYKEFKYDFESGIYQIVKIYKPVINDNINKYILKVYSILENATDEALSTLFLCMSSDVSESIANVPQRLKREEQEKELNRRLSLLIIPEDGVAEFSEIFWEMYEDNQKREEYVFAVFNKMKEVLVNHYYSDIIDLEGKSLRYLNSNLYHDTTINLIEDINILEKEIVAEI